MLSDRQKLILKAIIEEYVDSNEPVGSKILTEKPYLDFSSATIRYDMQHLEEDGYLEKPHTSSGRIPSQKGYRYYVENLVIRDQEVELLFNEIDQIFNNSSLAREDAIKQAMDLLSEVTGYMTMILGSPANYAFVKKMEIVPLGSSEAVLLIVTSAGQVQSQRITIPDGFKMDDLLRLIDMFDNAMYDHSIMEIRDVLSKEAAKPRIRKLVDFHDDILNFLIKAFSRFLNTESYQSGLSKIFNQPEFQNHESMQNILSMIDEETLISMLSNHTNGLSVKIGNDNDDSKMQQCSIVSVPYFIDDDESGTIAVVGPTRMQYKKVIPLLENIAKSMTKLYNR